MRSSYIPIFIAIFGGVIGALVAVFVAISAKRRREEHSFDASGGQSYDQRTYESRYRRTRSGSYPESHESYPGARPARSNRSVIFIVAIGLLLLGVFGFVFFLLNR